MFADNYLVLAKEAGFGQAQAGRCFHGRIAREPVNADDVRYGQGTRLIRTAATAG